MSHRLSPSEERQALALLEDALARDPADPATIIGAAGEVDRAIRERALDLLGAATLSAAAMRTGGAIVLGEDEGEELPDRIGNFEVVELLGRGGMGAVYKARRANADFDHPVAIKVIKPGIMSARLAERFRRERQILASLRHPHIARLYDGGETGDGAPYIIMELVEGTSLARWISREQPDLDARLELMAQICDAVEFAHQNLIIHRDLTPGNVLVTPAGQVKLIDFGIAREQADADPVQPHSALSVLSLTPGFAAPERRSGGAVTTLTDVYSLGRIMAHLLMGFHESELEAIAAKASADEPEDRYSGAALMARDIANFREGRAVEGFSDASSYRLRKYVTRHRVPVALAGLAAVLLVGGLVGVTDAYHDAARERDNAERRFAETHEIARTMMFGVYDELEGVPGAVSARALLADTTQRYLESLAADANADADLRFDAAMGYFRLAEVVGARTGGGTLGETSRARPYYEQSRDLLENLHTEFPGRQDIQAALGQVLAVMADGALFSDGNFENAKSNAREARALLADLAEPDAASTGALAMTWLHEGNALAFAGEPEPAGEAYRAGFAFLDGLPDTLRAALPVRRAEGELQRMSGAYHAYFERPDEARAAFEGALENWRAVAAGSDYAARDLYGLITAIEAVAQMELALGNAARADRLTTEAVDLARQGMAASPDDVGPQEVFTSAAIFRGRVLAGRGRFDEAAALADEAVALERSLRERRGNVASGPMTLAVRLQQASVVYLQADQQAKACPIMREAVGIMREYEQTAELPVANRVNNLEPMLEALRNC